MLTRLSLLTLMICHSVTSTALGGASPEHAYSGEDLFARGAYGIVVVATIISIDKVRKNTNGDPPRLRIKIHEVLKGSINPGEMPATWVPFPHDVDWTGEGSTERIKKWADRKNNPLEKGSKWILSSWQTGKVGHLKVAATARWPFTEEKRTWAVEKLRAPDLTEKK